MSRICKCGKSFTPPMRNGIAQSKLCPNCRWKKEASKKIIPATKSNYSRAKKEKTPRQKAMTKADNWFSRYIRIKYSKYIATDGTPICECIITGKLYAANMVDNGHCFSRDDKPTRFNEDNCRPQNRGSNRYRGEADHYKFIDNLKAEIGEERFNIVDKLRREHIDDNEQWYLEMSDKYMKLTNDLIKELGVRKWW